MKIQAGMLVKITSGEAVPKVNNTAPALFEYGDDGFIDGLKSHGGLHYPPFQGEVAQISQSGLCVVVVEPGISVVAHASALTFIERRKTTRRRVDQSPHFDIP